MKLTTLFIALAMVCMAIEGCDAQPTSKQALSEFESGLMRVNQTFISGFADRPAQIVTLDYKPGPAARAEPAAK